MNEEETHTGPSPSTSSQQMGNFQGQNAGHENRSLKHTTADVDPRNSSARQAQGSSHGDSTSAGVEKAANGNRNSSENGRGSSSGSISKKASGSGTDSSKKSVENISKVLLTTPSKTLSGLVVLATVAIALFVLAVFPLPQFVKPIPSVQVTSVQRSQHTVICPGGFAELGGNVAKPSDVSRVGQPDIFHYGGAQRQLLDVQNESASLSYTSSAHDLVAAAQSQYVDTEELAGFAATGCSIPLSEQWFVGGDTMIGDTASLTLSNPGEKPATVTVTVYSEKGQQENGGVRGVLVPAGQSRLLSINGLAPTQQALAVRVVSTGSAVSAAMSFSENEGIHPLGIDITSPQQAPESTLVFVGAHRFEGEIITDGNAKNEIEYQIMNTSDRVAEVSFVGFLPDGRTVSLGEGKFEPQRVTQGALTGWTDEIETVQAVSSEPLVGSVKGRSSSGGKTDFGWIAPASVIEASHQVPVALVDGAKIVLANTSGSEARVHIESERGVFTEILPPNSSRELETDFGSWALLTPSAPLRAAVRILGPDRAAFYPIVPSPLQKETITVYPR